MKSTPNPMASVEETLQAIMPDGERGKALPPVHLWEPERCIDIDMVIRSDGSWWHEGSRINRQKLVKLFSTILRKDVDGQTYLVTPYEKVIVHVEDAPFLAVRVDRAEAAAGAHPTLVFTTNLGDVAMAGPALPLRIDTDAETQAPSPYVLVRGRLEAKLTRPVFYELAEMAVENPADGGATLGVWSGGVFYVIGSAA